MTHRDRYGTLLLMLSGLAALTWLLLSSCKPQTAAEWYRDCYALDSGAAICVLDDDAPENIVPMLALGLTTWRAVFMAEWSTADLDDTLARTSVHYGRFADARHLPCDPDWAGCQDVNGAWWPELWTNRSWADAPDGSGTRDGNEWTSALQHECTHGAESWLERRDDYQHDDVPRRWTTLERAARSDWEEAAR
jgi:hypothetical protein